MKKAITYVGLDVHKNSIDVSLADGDKIALQEYIDAVRICKQREERIAEQIQKLVPDWRLGATVQSVQALRGISVIAAATVIAEVGDITRFDNPRQAMAYLGLVPSEHSSGEKSQKGSITKTGNSHA